MAAEPLSLATSLPDPALDPHHIHHPVDVPEGTGEVELTLEYDKIVDVVQISAVLLEPDGTFPRLRKRPKDGTSPSNTAARRPPARPPG